MNTLDDRMLILELLDRQRAILAVESQISICLADETQQQFDANTRKLTALVTSLARGVQHYVRRDGTCGIISNAQRMSDD